MNVFPIFLKDLGNSDVDITKDQADTLARIMHGTDYSDESFKKLNKALKEKGFSDNNADIIVDAAKATASDIMKKNVTIKDASILQKPTTYAQAYFSNPDKTVKTQRIATAIGAYAGLTVGGRYLSGGTLTTDSYGRKDIAGVPFL